MEEESIKVNVNGEEYNLTVKREENSIELKIDDKYYKLQLKRNGKTYFIYFKGKIFPIYVKHLDDDRFEIAVHGVKHEVKVKKKRKSAVSAKRFLKRGEYVIRSPIPGRVVSIPVEENSVVKEGETLIIIEAMKMRNAIKSPRKGIIKKIYVKINQLIEKNAALVKIQPSFS